MEHACIELAGAYGRTKGTIVAETTDAADKTAALKKITTIIYALYALSFLAGGIPSIVAIVMNYVKRDDVAGTLCESHFRWQMNTFWFALLWGAIGTLTFFFVIGWFILIADGIWVIYRVVKGWLNLNDNKPMYGANPPA